MKCSIVIAAAQKPLKYFQNTLESIFAQQPSFDWEVKVVLDGSPEDYFVLCQSYQKKHSNFDWKFLPSSGYRNPAVARNLAAKMATGDIFILQSDEVIHVGPDVIERLTLGFDPESFVHFADVFNTDMESGRRMENYSRNQHEGNRCLFFLGAISRKNFYAIGGNDEDFNLPGYEDAYFAACIRGRGIKEVYSSDIVGLHQHHPRSDVSSWYAQMKWVYDKKIAEATWTSASGPWAYEE